MKLILLLTTLLSFSAMAAELHLHCASTHNSDQLFALEAHLPEGQKNQLIAKAMDYRFFLSSMGDGVVELQVYNNAVPSRSYASAKLTDKSYVELVIWDRDTLLETRCTLIN